jgi:hypothetical protein
MVAFLLVARLEHWVRVSIICTAQRSVALVVQWAIWDIECADELRKE